MMLKSIQDHNPVMVQRFGADPWALVYNGRVYLYMTGDDPLFDESGHPLPNTYGNINTLNVISSSDLVNWVDHGAIPAAGKDGAAKWAANSWAPAAAWKKIDGKDRFFLYFADSGRGIGVLCADSPVGPFYDPIGGPLISPHTPACDTVTWLFDPAVMVDEDGTGYIYFGGGVPEGRQAAPGTARAARLGDDMISLAGDPVVIDPPYLFEDSGIHKVKDTYYYSYCTNFQVPQEQETALGFSNGEICYMTAKNPLGPFTFGGMFLKNPGYFFGVGGNNHHCVFQFEKKWYVAYHTQAPEKQLGWSAGYRSTYINPLPLGKDGAPQFVQADSKGVSQLHPFDILGRIQAETACTMAGVTTCPEKDAENGMIIRSTAPGGFIAIAQADFGEGVKQITLRFRSEAAVKLTIHPHQKENAPAVEIILAPTSEWQMLTLPLNAPLAGIQDVYFVFDDAGAEVDWWQFQ